MRFTIGPIDGVLVHDLVKRRDARGWLAELFRNDELPEGYSPAMAYFSETLPGVVRGPHEHREQADLFCFVEPSTFRMYLWDARTGSPTYGNKMVLDAGENEPRSVVVPAGVVHAYKNIGSAAGRIINLPNRLYAGAGRKEAVDEIRHENDPNTIFTID